MAGNLVAALGQSPSPAHRYGWCVEDSSDWVTVRMPSGVEVEAAKVGVWAAPPGGRVLLSVVGEDMAALGPVAGSRPMFTLGTQTTWVGDDVWTRVGFTLGVPVLASGHPVDVDGWGIWGARRIHNGGMKGVAGAGIGGWGGSGTVSWSDAKSKSGGSSLLGVLDAGETVITGVRGVVPGVEYSVDMWVWSDDPVRVTVRGQDGGLWGRADLEADAFVWSTGAGAWERLVLPFVAGDRGTLTVDHGEGSAVSVWIDEVAVYEGASGGTWVEPDPNGLTVPFGGRWRLSASGRWEASLAGGRGLQVRTSGGTVLLEDTVFAVRPGLAAASSPLQLEAGTRLDLYVWQNSGAASYFNSGALGLVWESW